MVEQKNLYKIQLHHENSCGVTSSHREQTYAAPDPVSALASYLESIRDLGELNCTNLTIHINFQGKATETDKKTLDGIVDKEK